MTGTELLRRRNKIATKELFALMMKAPGERGRSPP